MAYTLRSIDIVSAMVQQRWLSKMSDEQGGRSLRALAGSLLAASEEDWSTVSVFKNPLFGNKTISDEETENKAASRDSKSQQSSIATSPLG